MNKMHITSMRAKVYTRFRCIGCDVRMLFANTVCTLKDKSLILVYTVVDQCYLSLFPSIRSLSLARSLILSLAMRVLCIVYGSSLICSDYESDAGVYCHCTLFCIYFAIFPLLFPSFSLFTFLFFPFALKFR